MDGKKLTDSEILQMIEDFKSLSDEEMKSRLIGQGMWKDVYDVPNSDYVLKRARPDLGGSNTDLIKDYIASKQIGKHIPVEQPILTLPSNGQEAFLIQKKLKEGKVLGKDVKSLQNTLGKAGFELDSGDVDVRNLGRDVNNNLKAFDVDPEPFSFNNKLNNSLKTARETALQKLGTPSIKNRIFRSMAGALPLAGTAMALSSGDANAAVEELPSEIPGIGQVYDALRSDPAGSAEDDKMMITEVNARKNYENSPANQARLKALQGLGTKK